MTVLGFFSASRALIAAISSMRLFVVNRSPPKISFSFSPMRRIAPQPPGPGLPLHAPSVKISTSGLSLMIRRSQAVIPERRRAAVETQIGEVLERILALHQRVGRRMDPVVK